MAFDLVVKNGTVIDGSGLPRFAPTSAFATGASPALAASASVRVR